MLLRIKHLLKDNALVIAIAITALILYLSLFKMPNNVGFQVKNIDKVYHAIAYFTLTFAWLLVFINKKKQKLIVVISCIIFGIVIEALQNILTNYRTADYRDAIANSLGVLVAFIIFNLFFKKLKIN